MLTLLSPAKTMDFSTAPKRLPATKPQFGKDIAVLLERCKKLDAASLQKLMKLSEPLAELNYERFQAMRLPFTDKNSKLCLLAFQGDVYRKLDAASLSKRDLRWAQNHIRILSGLYGLLRPLDLIQPYRLEMGTRLDNSRGKNLYEFWGNRLVDELNAEQKGRAVVLNLASNEYFKAVPKKRLESRLVTAVFQEIRDGKPKTIAFSAKRARGLMARYVVDNRIDDPEGLKNFAEDGYGFRKDLSEDDRLVFTRG
ncbi:MAG: peroxide stress protein YaaA [bacterium]|nr:peroxide stress protein YaaA [bacterium]